ncbi:hypothetical protein QEH56_00650 [Pelagicoccus enzymogenes]|uniref:hypothetical protein n=1 Tax=Pelagicoccus enzymogenes TaxID=2773457 RepID=UPI00280DA0E0|nr:hypothetical protein [Pelagicoccus enzymogenes]MDQ8196632.1 hypothetical protein [Pelagicoccus enzymogenes]
MSSINESLLAIVKERRASYVKSLRMLFLSMATLLAFHVLIFEPYLEAQTRLIQVKREQVASVAIESNIEKRREAYAEIGEELSGRIELLLVVMMDDIASDLRGLTRDLAPYLPESVPAATPEEEARRPAFQMQMQMQELRPRPGSGFGNAIIQELQSARNWGDVRKTMQPWVAENVIDVRFSEYNESIGSFIDGALSEIDQVRGNQRDLSFCRRSCAGYGKEWKTRPARRWRRCVRSKSCLLRMSGGGGPLEARREFWG